MHDVATKVQFIDLNIMEHRLLIRRRFYRRPGERLYRLRRRLCPDPGHDEPGGARDRGRGQQHVPQVPQGHGGSV